VSLSEKIIFVPSNDRDQPEELKQLLARLSVIRNGCDLDLLVFLHRHPRTLLTNEQIAAFVGYDMKKIAQSLDAFIEAGLLERTQNPMHAARMYLLQLNGLQNPGFKKILEIASTREGRRAILSTLKVDKSGGDEQLRHFRLLKSACA
jgi:DNA-binding MarR family transcriptional regulator